jgi:quercetin dioxygenase-like cupin family protein
MTKKRAFLPGEWRARDWCLGVTSVGTVGRLLPAPPAAYTGDGRDIRVAAPGRTGFSPLDATMFAIPRRLRQASLLLALCAAGYAHAAPPEPVVTALGTKALPDMPGKEILMLQVDYPPGAADPLHRHDAHAMVYVLEGSVVMGVKGGKEVTLKPGETFYEGPQDVHTVGRNASKTRPARFVVFLLKDQGKPALIPLQHP